MYQSSAEYFAIVLLSCFGYNFYGKVDQILSKIMQLDIWKTQEQM
jgi:hypothetical protein